ncbi:MAG: hypothetical protein J0I47_08455 [Sphingomonas sp.]|uniref:hypothetical protein n=1 Tax=Sphingomonas sp. TaxID=28214 RepID=UPI001AD28E2A|nr:hypothetical protein [Sphingomonas sp.]MBN8808254.1 hypothetical protein [Sphingomonas sp.]
MCAEIELGRLCLGCGVEADNDAGIRVLFVHLREMVIAPGLRSPTSALLLAHLGCQYVMIDRCACLTLA